MYITESSAIKVGSFINVVEQPEFHTRNITGSQLVQRGYLITASIKKTEEVNIVKQRHFFICTFVKVFFCVCDIVIVITLSLAEAILLAPLR